MYYYVVVDVDQVHFPFYDTLPAERLEELKGDQSLIVAGPYSSVCCCAAIVKHIKDDKYLDMLGYGFSRG